MNTESLRVNFYDIDAAAKAADFDLSEDASALFVADAEGYTVNGGVYKVDADTILRLTETPVNGVGSVMWKDYHMLGTTTGNTDLFDGIVPVSKLHDPIFMSTALPSEAETHLTHRVNATNMAPAEEKWRKLLSIGAIYKENNSVLPDDAEVTICFGRIFLVGCTEEQGWFMADDMAHPAMPKHIFYLPWSLEHSLGVAYIPPERITVFDDRVEVRLTGAMLNGTYNVPDEYLDQVEGSVIHFWGRNWEFEDGSKVLGAVGGLVAWIKEPEYVGKVLVAVGADWRPENNQALQCYSGRNFVLSTQPRIMYAHNVGPKAYDRIMDSDKVQRLMGIK